MAHNRKTLNADTGNTILRRMFFTILLTTMIIEFTQVGSNFIDGIITSKLLSADEMAAVGMAYPVFSLVGIISGCLATGMRTLCSQEIGRGNTKRLSKLFSETVCISVLIALAIVAGLYFARYPFAKLIGANDNASNLLEPTVQYILGLLPGIPAIMVCATMSPGIQLDNGYKLINIGAIADLCVNSLFDVLAIRLNLGVFGIGLATSLGRWVNLAVILTHFFKKNRVIHFRIGKASAKDMGSIVSLGSLVAVKRAANIVGPVIINNLVVAAGGSAAMTVVSVRNSINNLGEIPIAGIAGAVGILTAIFFGEINKDEINDTGKNAHKLTFIIVGVVSILTAVLSRVIAVFYLGADSESLDLMTFAIICLAIRWPIQTLVESRISYLQSVRQIKRSNILTFAVRFVSLVGCTIVLNWIFGIYGIMAAFPAASLVTLIAITIVYQVKTKSFVPKQKDYMILEDKFEIAPQDIIEYPIRNLDDASLASEQLELFARGHKIPQKRAYYAALCVEEMLQNTIERGFTQSKKKLIDLRVVISDEDIVIRIRDDCKEFSLPNQIKLVEDKSADDPAGDVGIKMVSKLAKDITYYRSFDTNNTIIRI